MTGLLIIIILIIVWPYLWRLVRPWFYRWLQHCTEYFLRRAVGMPPRDKTSASGRRPYSSKASSGRTTAGKRHRRQAGPVIPKEYAEDVEFTEIRSYSEDSEIASDGEVRFRRESQVSDAEIIEIKKDK